jgi:hypothetical protein
MNEDTEEDVLLDALALPRPEVIPNKRAIEDARKILNPKPAEWEQCLETIRDAFVLIEHSGLFRMPRSKKTNEALAELLAALERARAVKRKLPWFEARFFEIACDLEEGIAFCKHEKDTPLRKSGPPSFRQQQAVETAYYLVQFWLVQKRGVDKATSLSKQSPWFKLSAILFGDEKKNLLKHMSRWVKGQARFNDIADMQK